MLAQSMVEGGSVRKCLELQYNRYCSFYISSSIFRQKLIRACVYNTAKTLFFQQNNHLKHTAMVFKQYVEYTFTVLDGPDACSTDITMEKYLLVFMEKRSYYLRLFIQILHDSVCLFVKIVCKNNIEC